MASAAVSREVVSALVEEIGAGVDAAVECWMAQIERALGDPHLTTLGRLNAVNEILANYKGITGKVLLGCRRAS